ncbi:conserved hypothetical protein [Coccidioides posadasii str. Silveira]|uniref:Uncharacterized protein n=1 Tax=Coccidioides posadasii (strain RMSCC 757 / Silveira) TaxID=443226 RepID=E9DHJ8_COCPS|nr:conserved hypothetical protein [Coccidioides posadasii str. Silveira]
MHLLNSGRRTPKVHKRNADSKFGVWHFKAVTPCLLAQVCHRHRIGYFYVIPKKFMPETQCPPPCADRRQYFAQVAIQGAENDSVDNCIRKRQNLQQLDVIHFQKLTPLMKGASITGVVGTIPSPAKGKVAESYLDPELARRKCLFSPQKVICLALNLEWAWANSNSTGPMLNANLISPKKPNEACSKRASPARTQVAPRQQVAGEKGGAFSQSRCSGCRRRSSEEKEQPTRPLGEFRAAEKKHAMHSAGRRSDLPSRKLGASEEDFRVNKMSLGRQFSKIMHLRPIGRPSLFVDSRDNIERSMATHRQSSCGTPPGPRPSAQWLDDLP